MLRDCDKFLAVHGLIAGIRTPDANTDGIVKFYTCVNEASLSSYADHLRVALATARAVGGLDPHVLFDGDPAVLRAILGATPATIHTCQTSLLTRIRETPEVYGWARATAEGALLRLEIPLVETSDALVLYGDCDVIFTRKVDLSGLAPRFLAAAPGHNPCEWGGVCSGVMLLNLPALRAEYPGIMKLAAETLGRPHFYDQEVLNLYFEGRMDRLPLDCHWKTYWGANPFARIVHFHGPKRFQIDILQNKGPGSAAMEEYFATLCMNRDGLAYYARLFDLEAAASPPGWRERMRIVLPQLARSIRAKGRGALRGLRLLPDHPGFDEQYYLYANPDVAIGVYTGAIPSARWHYETCGRAEGRAQAAPWRGT